MREGGEGYKGSEGGDCRSTQSISKADSDSGRVLDGCCMDTHSEEVAHHYGPIQLADVRLISCSWTAMCPGRDKWDARLI